jgi:serine/threonine-protein kinase
VVTLSRIVETLTDPSRLSIRAEPIGDRTRRVFELLTAQAEPLQRRREIGVYRIIEDIGETMEYREYLAKHRYLASDPRARLKVYHFDAYQGPDRRARQIELIMRDINALRCLGVHPNIARAVDIFPWESNRFVMVTEWIDGDTLRARLEARDGPLSEREVVYLARQIGRGLAHAHNHGVIHRDLRPENIVIAHDRRVKLTNFDCARVSLPKVDTIAGQISAFWDERYVAPEALLDPRRASATTDLYSVGVVLYECLVGDLPYANIAEILRHSQFDRVPSQHRSDLHPAWDGLIARLCDFEPNARYRRASQFLEDLERANIVAPESN